MMLESLLQKQYGYTIQPFEDEYFKGFVGRYNDLPVEVYGETENLVLEDLRLAKIEYFATCIKEKTVEKIPKPTIFNNSDYSGRVTARLGKTLHRRLSEYAMYDGVSLNQAIQMLIERGLQETNINRFDKKLDENNENQEKIAKELLVMNFSKHIEQNTNNNSSVEV